MSGRPFSLERAKANFWSKVDKTGNCWLWTGAHLPKGYGKVGIHYKTLAAHRASWMLNVGDIPDGMQVLHRCDTPAYVRPDHLFLGTNAENREDSLSKGRVPRGANHYHHLRPDVRRFGEATGHAKLTEPQVRAIRSRHAAGEGVPALAEAFGVSMGAIYHIVRRETWRHVL